MSWLNWQFGAVLLAGATVAVVRKHPTRYLAIFGLVCTLAGWIGSTFLKSK